MNALALALNWAAMLGNCERNPAEVDRLASDSIELSTRHNLGYFLTASAIHRGWARSASGNTTEGIRWIEQGIRDFRAAGTVLGMPGYLARKAEALHLADRTSERERQPKPGSDPKTSAFREASGAVADVSVSLGEFIRVRHDVV